MTEQKYRQRGYKDAERSGSGSGFGPSGPPRGERIGPKGRGADRNRAEVFRCKTCSEKNDPEVGPESVCKKCGAALHACAQGRVFDGAAHLQCRQEIPAPIPAKSKANDCTFYAPTVSLDLTGTKAADSPSGLQPARRRLSGRRDRATPWARKTCRRSPSISRGWARESPAGTASARRRRRIGTARTRGARRRTFCRRTRVRLQGRSSRCRSCTGRPRPGCGRRRGPSDRSSRLEGGPKGRSRSRSRTVPRPCIRAGGTSVRSSVLFPVFDASHPRRPQTRMLAEVRDMKIILRILINAAALWVAASFVPGIHAGGIGSILALALVFGLVNAFVRPFLKLVSCPIILLTLGLFTLVVNALMLMLAAWLGRGLGIEFTVDGFVPAFLGALIISVVSTLLSWILISKSDS